MATRVLPYACRASLRLNGLLCARPLRNDMTIARSFHTASRRYEQQANTKVKRDSAPQIVRGDSKLYKDADAAVADIKSGATILSAGFGLCGTAGKFNRTIQCLTG
jgi:3-oxoacid CoA-transferase